MRPADVAKKFAEFLSDVRDEEVVETAFQIACAFIEKRALGGEFAAFVDGEAEVYEEHRNNMLEADLNPDEPSVEHLRERVARLETWLANAKKNLAEYERYVAETAIMSALELREPEPVIVVRTQAMPETRNERQGRLVHAFGLRVVKS